MTQYVFGLGTGRCGTASLARLLDEQHDSSFGHEGMPLHWWHIMSDYDHARKLIIKQGEWQAFSGNVGYYWLPYAHKIVKDFPNAKFIVLTRKTEDVVESFWNRNLNRIEDETYFKNAWWSSYPFLRYPPTKDAIRDTVEQYKTMIDIMLLTYSHRTFVTGIDNLNDMDKMSKLLEFVGIEKERQVLKPFRENAGGKMKLGILHTIRPKASQWDVLISERFKEN